jgi:hypothetical protein
MKTVKKNLKPSMFKNRFSHAMCQSYASHMPFLPPKRNLDYPPNASALRCLHPASATTSLVVFSFPATTSSPHST